MNKSKTHMSCHNVEKGEKKSLLTVVQETKGSLQGTSEREGEEKVSKATFNLQHPDLNTNLRMFIRKNQMREKKDKYTLFFYLSNKHLNN